MKEEPFTEFYEFHYRAKESKGFRFVVYARSEEIADAIMAIESAYSPWTFVHAKIGFKKRHPIGEPPYEVEEAERQTAYKRLKHRQAFFKELPKKKEMPQPRHHLVNQSEAIGFPFLIGNTYQYHMKSYHPVHF